MTSPDTVAAPDKADRRGRSWPSAAVVAFAAITWPWLLRSLWGGKRADKTALLARLDLPPDALPKLGGWRADVRFLTRLVGLIETQRPAVIVELGGGTTSLVMAAALARVGTGRLVSYEAHLEFAEETRASLLAHGLHAEIVHSPLIENGDGPTRWYALSDVPAAIDLLVVDGPPWTVHPQVRGAAERLFARVSPGGIVLLDDAARPGERLVARRWRRDWPQFAWRYEPLIKGLLTGVRQR